jgi:glycogen synthase
LENFKQTKDKTMTFDKWYERQNPDLDPRLDGAFNELRSAYEAGAATQDKTLRDEFAGQAMAGITQLKSIYASDIISVTEWAYTIADAMLEARKTPTEDDQ